MGYFHYIALALAALPFNELDPSLISPQQHVSVEGLHPTKQLNPYLPKKDFWNTDYGKALLSEETYAPRRYLRKGNVIQDKNIHEEEIVEDEDEDEDIQDEDDEDEELERNPEDFDEDGFQNDGDDQDDSLNQRVSHRRILNVKSKGGKSGGGDGSSGGGKKGGSSGGSKVAGSGGKGSRTNQPGYRALPDLRGYERVPKTVKGTNDKSFWGKKLRGSSYSRSGCGYSGMPCSSFVYPYRSYSASTYSYHSSYRYYYPYYYPYYGYHRPSYYKGPGDDLTDYQWNILSTLPYIAKSPLFGKRNVHGKPFDDVEDAPQITTGKVKMVTIYGTTRVTSISFQFFGGRSLSHGTQQNGETPVQLALDEDEDLVEGSFSNCKVNGHTRLCGATFTTTKGKTISHGRFGKTVHQTVSPKGFSIGGFFGRQGKNFDYLGLVAINFDVMNSFSEQYSIAEFDGSTWYNTQFPGIAASYVVGGNNGYYYNMGLLLPYSIYEMRINKVSMYGKKKLAGMSFAYDDGSIIDIGTVKDEGDPTIVDLGTTGRINQITITQYRAKKTVCNEYVCSTKKRRRIAGAQFQFTDKDGKNQSASGGDVDLNKLQNDVFDIPDGTDVVATVGSQGSRLDNIGFLIRKSKTAKELASAPLPSP